MTSPSPIQIQARAIPEVVSISGNTARIRFGGKTWDITVEDKCHSVSLDDKLASIIQSHFQSLFDQKIISAQDKKIVLQGRHDPANHEHLIMDKILSSNSLSNDVKELSADVQQKALPILHQLGEKLSGPSLFTPKQSPLQAPLSTAQTSPVDDEKSSSIEIDVDHLNSQFSNREKRQITQPFDVIAKRFNLDAKDSKKQVADCIGNIDKKVRKWVVWHETVEGNGFEREPLFAIIYNEMNFVTQKNPDGFKNLGKDYNLSDVKVRELLAKDRQNITEDERRSLVQVYAAYLRGPADVFDAGPSFYKIAVHILSQINPQQKMHLAMIEKQDSSDDLTLVYPSQSQGPIDGQNTLFLYFDKDTNRVELYDDAPADLLPLNQITNLAKCKQKIQLHEDLKDQKTSALRALAHQILARENKSTSDKSLVDAKMQELRDALVGFIDINELEPELIASTKEKLLAIYAAKNKSDELDGKTDQEHIDCFINELKHNSEVDFDELSFKLLSTSYQIAVLQDSSDPNKPFKLDTRHFYALPQSQLDPAQCLLLWQSSKTGLYRSMIRDSNLLTPLIHK